MIASLQSTRKVYSLEKKNIAIIANIIYLELKKNFFFAILYRLCLH